MNIRLKSIALAAAAAFSALMMASVQASASDTITVGVYQNMPLTFIEPQGTIKGFFVDDLEHVAAKEGWKIKYDPDS